MNAVRRCRRERTGFTLLEIVLALAIAVIAMSLLSLLVGIANRSAAASRDLTRAQLIAESIMAEFAAGVMMPQTTSGTYELDPMWTFNAQVTGGNTENLNVITVTVTHEADVPNPTSFSLTQWLFIPPEPVEEEESSTTSASLGGGA